MFVLQLLIYPTLGQDSILCRCLHSATIKVLFDNISALESTVDIRFDSMLHPSTAKYMTDIVVFNPCYNLLMWLYNLLGSISRSNQCYRERNHLQMFVSNWTDMSNSHPRELVGHGSETQLRVDGNECFNVEHYTLTAKLFNLNFHPLEVVSRWRDPQLQGSENYADLTKRRSTLFKSCWLVSHYGFNMFKRRYWIC